MPVFIIGMPRSGLDAGRTGPVQSPRNLRAGEIKEFSRQLNTLRGPLSGLPKYPADRAAHECRAICAGGRCYLSKVTALAPHAARITDKLLTNYYFVGLLHTLFRMPVSSTRGAIRSTPAFRAFTKLFKDDMPHSYDLGELGRYYRKYDELMPIGRRSCPAGVMKTFVYEDVVGDLPRMARELIDFVRLPWNDACLSFHESSRPVRTASCAGPQAGLFFLGGRFRRYGRELQPLIDALGYTDDGRPKSQH